jgi:hypothetical protein
VTEERDGRSAFLRFADEARLGDAPLYERLTRAAAEDPALCELLMAAPPPQRRGTTFFAAVHYSLLRNPDHALAALYPSTGGDPSAGDPFPPFRDLCLSREDELRPLLATRATQTNEVARCASILPCLGIVASLTGRPLALVEAGASAGLNLLLDRYHYNFGPAGSVGDIVSPVRIAPEARGPIAAPVPAAMPVVESRIGVDLAPINLHDEDAVRWLRACVWTEHAGRASMLGDAIDLARDDPPTVEAGDALDRIGDLVRTAPPGAEACVFHTNTLVYVSPADAEGFQRSLRELSAGRDLWWIGNERVIVEMMGLAEDPARREQYAMPVTMTRLSGGEARPALVAYAHPHGTWLEWLTS